MAGHSEYILEPYREETEFVFYRGREYDGSMPILAVGAAAEQPSPQALRRLEHEWSLAPELDTAWAAQPLRLSRYQGRTVLILKNPGGELLDRLIERQRRHSFDLTRFLRIAIGLAAAVGQAHRQGLIHKDVKPENVLVDETGRAWLTGFGVASQLPQERQVPTSPEIIGGSLAYMSPEQTGRMNRSIDSRSDLYSLGVTLYQMFTGVLPFTAADALEWIHCHIARQPAAPIEQAAVPETLSAIILKLLSKNAEERYQTAAGLEADLRRCLLEWELHGYIHPFPLGMDDSSDRLLIAEKLYGREREVETLVAAFDRVVTLGAAEFVLVSGYSGIGKSSVVNELHKVLVPPRGLFAAGKFDQYKRDVPYATLAQAFQTMVRQILVKGEEEVDRWRRGLLEALGPNGQLVVNLIPELEFIIGKQPSVSELPAQEARGRFQLVFRRFLSAFATADHPLALFLDDLQWLDTATLELLERLVTDPDVRHVLIIGAYRDNEVGPSHPLSRTLAGIRDRGARIQEIVLQPLGLDDVERLVADALHCNENSVAALALLVHEKTGGNPFFAIQFFTSLADEGLVRFDQSSAGWGWDLDRIRAKGYSDNVVDLMVGRLRRLPDRTQQALQHLACLGNAAKIATLKMIFGQSEEEIQAGFLDAARTGLILRLEDSYAFLHDRVQEAAYSLIPRELRAEAHLRIGRAMASQIPSDELEEGIFEIVSQLNRGSHLVTSHAELERTAELNLIAGRRAKMSTAYASALKFLHAGLGLLTDETWNNNHDLIFSIESLLAECELLSADMAAAESRLSTLAERAGNTHETSLVTRLRLTLYTALGRSDRAVEVFIEFQKGRGRDWSPHPNNAEVSEEYERIWLALGDRKIEDLVDLPVVTSQDVLDVMDVFMEVVTPALFTDENFLVLVICRVVNLALECGNCDASCFAYVWLAVLAGSHFGNYPAGLRFAKLGYDLVESRGWHRYQARIYLSVGHLVMPWTQHVKTGRELMRRAFDAANRNGDLTYIAYSTNNLITNLLASGDSLAEVQSEAEVGLERARNIPFGIVVAVITAQLGFVKTLRGLTTRFGSFDASDFDELQFEHYLSADPILALPECWYWVRKLQARFLAGDYPAANQASLNAERLLWTSPSFFELAEYHFFSALTLARLVDSTSGDSRQERFAALTDHQKQLGIWAENCPENFDSRAAIVGAEIARIEGRDVDAMRLFEQAIQSASTQGFVHNEAIAWEVAAHFYAARGFAKIAEVYLRDARNCYRRWGADGKVKQLDQLFPRSREGRTPAASGTFDPRVEQFDVETVVRASQALSSEMVLPTLIEKLMRFAMEHAGAGRGLLILVRESEPRIEAEAITLSDGIEVVVRQRSVASSDLPQSALHYVTRTTEHVLLDDATTDSVYSQDEYVRQKSPRSVLCLPIVRQARLIGVLYLENNLAPFVFTPDRLAVLQLLASQAAISLENAALYTNLQRSEAFLAQGQKLSHTGSFGRSALSDRLYWSEETYRIYELDRSVEPTLEWLLQRIHPEDRNRVQQTIDRAVHQRTGFDIEYRLMRHDDTTKHLHVVVQALEGASGELELMGAVTDITERKLAEDALRQAQSDLARINRVTTMGELTASLAHEISQPISGVISNANASILKLARENPNVKEVKEAVSRIVRDGQRAAAILARIRSQFQQGALDREVLDMNEIGQETIALMRSEAGRYNVSVRAELTDDRCEIVGDRVQLQQVLMNLIVNGIESMKDIHGIRELIIRSQKLEGQEIRVSISDTGLGIPSEIARQIFDPFFTTKASGTGMGLRISRSIIEAHGGRLWADDSQGPGATFHLTLPVANVVR